MADEGLMAFEPLEQKTVLFYGDELVALRMSDGQILVPIKPICDLLGVNWDGQRQRVQRDEILAAESRLCTVITTGQGRQMLCLPLKYLSGFLFGISSQRVKEGLRERLLQYQRDCYEVLAQAFQEGRLSADGQLAELLNGDSPAAQAYRMAQAIMQMARQQLILEARVERHEQRLELLEAQLGHKERFISADQATQISQAVKAIALELGKRSNRNEFGGVYGELYRRYQVPTYRELPAQKWDDVMNFLRQWWQAVTQSAEFPF